MAPLVAHAAFSTHARTPSERALAEVTLRTVQRACQRISRVSARALHPLTPSVTY